MTKITPDTFKVGQVWQRRTSRWQVKIIGESPGENGQIMFEAYNRQYGQRQFGSKSKATFQDRFKLVENVA